MFYGKRRATLKEQDYIESLLHTESIEDSAIYDAFEEDYDWSDV